MRAVSAALIVLVMAGSGHATAQNIDYAMRTTAAYDVEGLRDPAESGTDRVGVLNLAPRALIEFNPAWTGYVRGRIFLPTRRTSPFDSSEPDSAALAAPARAFAGINEMWIQYNGLTSYPGEAVRLGRQHIRQTDSEWWDQDAEALRWIFDTTLLSADIGVARASSDWRTDDVEVPAAQRDRTYLFGHVAMDWRAQHTLGLRMTHADSAVSDERLTWIGVYADNGFHNTLSAEQRASYGVAINHLVGPDVSAWQAGAAARWRPMLRAPLQFGGGYTWSEGGESGGRSHQYRQTGMQSNTSYFTGTGTLIGRYNEILRPELGNLSVATGFASLTFAANDASLVITKFRKDSGPAPIATRHATLVPVNDDPDIGSGVDLVFTHYFAREPRRQRLLDRGDAFTAPQRRSLFSVRVSFFDPGNAYGPAARSGYRVLMETTLWLN
jgi:alginate production protein